MRWPRNGWARARAVFTVVLAAVGGLAIYQHRSEIAGAGAALSHVRVGWLFLSIVAELGSMAAFARLQRWLLRAGGVDVSLGLMVEITVAGNALSTSLPGGAAWSATWSFEQLRRHGAQKVLAAWVILVAGALSSFAVFEIVAIGSWVAGARGPVADLRWLAAALQAVPLVVAVGYLAVRRRRRLRRVVPAQREAVAGQSGAARWAINLVGRTGASLEAVQPGRTGWAGAFGLAMVNWLDDCVCLVACMVALSLAVPWRDVLVVYGLTQVAASLPITPGGIGVVEGSMTALLVAYGTRPTWALATVLLYRIVSFWGLVPVGWGAWLGLEVARRRGLRHRAHPWAEHQHGPPPPVARAPIGPEHLLRPDPCTGCPPGGAPEGRDPTPVAGPAAPGSLAGAGTAVAHRSGLQMGNIAW